MDQAIIRSPSAGLSLPGGASRTWLGTIAATLILILLANPVGFVGGGWDDWQYLNAARCWVENGSCLPGDHWQGRWPVIAPIAAVTALLGESRLTVGLPSLAYAIGCLFLLARLGNRLAGRPVGYLAALILLVMPIFGVELLGPNAEHPELFFLLAAANLVQGYADSRNVWLAFAAGLCWSLAFQVRETAVAALPLLALSTWVLARRDQRALLAAVIGAAIPLLFELLIYYATTGDPLWRRHLSISHTGVPSTELVGPVDHSRPPFFNPGYIAAWKHQPGLQVHWTVDGLLNLLVNMMAGLGIGFSLLLAALSWRRLSSAERRWVAWCLGAAVYWACFLIYALAIDPKPRMMFVPVALTAVALAIILRRLVRSGSAPLASVILALCWLAGIAHILLHPQVRNSEGSAVRWAEQHAGRIETNETTRRHLALVPAASDFAELSSERPMLVIKLDSECEAWADRYLPGRLRLVEQASFSANDRLSLASSGGLCLFRYERVTTPADIAAARLAAPGRR